MWKLREEHGNHVTRALGFGNGICVGEVVGKGFEGPLYVVIGIDEYSPATYTNTCDDDDEMEVEAQAYLTSAGRGRLSTLRTCLI